MVQTLFTAAFVTIMSIIGGVAVLRIVEFARSTAATGSVKRIIIGGLGFVALVVGGVSVLTWVLTVAMPTVTNSLASSPTASTVYAAGSQLAGAVDNGSFSMPSLPSVVGGAMPTMLALPAMPSSPSSPSMPAVANQPTAVPQANGEPIGVMLKPLGELFGGTTAKPVESSTYIVQGGDSLSKIAAKLGLTTQALCTANKLSDCNLLRRGQSLIVPAAGVTILQAPVQAATTAKINAPRVAAPTVVYYEPKLNQSYIPKTWNTLEEGQMSIGEPATMNIPTPEVLFSSK